MLGLQTFKTYTMLIPRQDIKTLRIFKTIQYSIFHLIILYNINFYNSILFNMLSKFCARSSIG